MFRAILNRWPLFAFVASAAMLAAAHAFETFGHFAPCHLCLQQREVYWTALGLSAATLLIDRTPFGRRAQPWACLLLALVFLFGSGLAFFHFGVEHKWWPGPTICTGGGRITAASLKAAMSGHAKVEPPACDRIVWSLLGLTMAGWNSLISLGLAAASAVAARLGRRP